MDKFNKMLAGGEPMVLSIFRIITGLLLFQYGVAKIFKFPVLPYFANIPPLITVAGRLKPASASPSGSARSVPSP